MVNCKLCDTRLYLWGAPEARLPGRNPPRRPQNGPGSGVSAALRGDRGILYRHALQKKGRRVSVGVLERLFGAKGVGRALVLHLGDRGLDERKRAELAVSTLTPCEKEVLLLLARGWTNVQIAEALHISERTAKFYVHNVTEKLGGPDRKRTTERAIELSLVSDEH